MKNKKNGFTLVELLAVIVILAVILVIAVPKVMSVIEDSKKATLESTAKMIASSAEKAKVQNAILGNIDTITCESVAKTNDIDYEDCDIDFDENTAKVTIKGKGKFNGFWVSNGTKANATAINESCGLRTLIVNLDDGTDTVEYNAKYEAGSEVTLTPPTKEGYIFNGWTVTGTGASVNGNTLIMGSEATIVTATWEEITPVSFSTDSWETIVAAVKQAETNGAEYPYNVGDEKTIDLGTTLGTHTVRIANKTKCNALQIVPVSKTSCGFVLEFKDIISTHNMNPSGKYNGIQYDYGYNLGGWPNSKMRAYLNDLDARNDTDGVIYNALPDALKNGMIDTYVISSKGNETIVGYENVVDGNFYSRDKLYLLSPEEIYDTSFTSSSDTSRGTSRQLDYYATYEGDGYTGVSTTNIAGAIKYNGSTASIWWLRSAYSANGNYFYTGWLSGGWSYRDANNSYGVSPAFRLAN